jgi:hypothetical protein
MLHKTYVGILKMRRSIERADIVLEASLQAATESTELLTRVCSHICKPTHCRVPRRPRLLRTRCARPFVGAKDELRDNSTIQAPTAWEYPRLAAKSGPLEVIHKFEFRP